MGPLKFGKKVWYRHVAAIGAVMNIVLMMAANLVGFVIGTDGIRFFVDELFGTWQGWSLQKSCAHTIYVRRLGLRFFVGACFCLFVGAQLMFEYRYVILRSSRGPSLSLDLADRLDCREEEKRNGIFRRC